MSKEEHQKASEKGKHTPTKFRIPEKRKERYKATLQYRIQIYKRKQEKGENQVSLKIF